MSENYSCRDTYCNYGSYLRSRGFDKEMCTIINDLKAQLMKMDNSIQPGNCETGAPTTISGDVIIDTCENDTANSSGTLTIYGGNATNPSIQTSGGASIKGESTFIGDVIVRGNLAVTGYVQDISAVSVFEALEIETKAGFNGDSLAVFQARNVNGNLQALWSDISANISGPAAWKEDLVFAVDGPYTTEAKSNGATNVTGHVRGLRGATFMNPPGNTGVNVDYERNFTNATNKNIALDLYGNLNISTGNDNAPALVDIQDGQLSIYKDSSENIRLHNDGSGTFTGLVDAYDLSINHHASIHDLSVVHLMTVGTSTTHISSSVIDAENIMVDNLQATKINVDELTIENEGKKPTLLNIQDGEFSIYDGETVNINLNKDGSGTFAGLVDAYDLSINHHASIHDLSVVHLMTVGTSTTHISSNTIEADNVVVDNLNANKISVDELLIENPDDDKEPSFSIQDGEFSIYDGKTLNMHMDKNGNGTFNGLVDVYDLSVNHQASIYDLSVVHLMSVGTSTTHISSSTIDADNINSKKITVDDLTVQNNIHISELNIDDLNIAKNITFDKDKEHTIDFNSGNTNNGYIRNDGNIAITSNNILQFSANSYINFNKNPRLIFPELCNANNTICNPFTLFGSARALLNMTPEDNSVSTHPIVLRPDVDSAKCNNYPEGTFNTGFITLKPEFFQDCIIEISVSINCSFGSQSEGLTCLIYNDDPNATNPRILEIDTRTIMRNYDKQLSFGPKSFYTDSSANHIDMTKNLIIKLERVGGTSSISINSAVLDLKTTRYATPQ